MCYSATRGNAHTYTHTYTQSYTQIHTHAQGQQTHTYTPVEDTRPTHPHYPIDQQTATVWCMTRRVSFPAKVRSPRFALEALTLERGKSLENTNAHSSDDSARETKYSRVRSRGCADMVTTFDFREIVMVCDPVPLDLVDLLEQESPE
jgi:hypothetical protein